MLSADSRHTKMVTVISKVAHQAIETEFDSNEK